MTITEAKPIASLREFADKVESGALDQVAIDAGRRGLRQRTHAEQSCNDLLKDCGGMTKLLAESMVREVKKHGHEITLMAAELRSVHLMGKTILDRARFLREEAAANIGSRTDLYRDPVREWVAKDRDGAEAFALHCFEVERFLKKNMTQGDRGAGKDIFALHKMLGETSHIRATVDAELEATAHLDTVSGRYRLAGRG